MLTKLFLHRCTYDFLEITELPSSPYISSEPTGKHKTSRLSKPIFFKTFQKRSSYDTFNKNLHTTNTSTMTTATTPRSNSNSNQNNAQYKNLQTIFTNLYKTRKHFIIQTPEYPKGIYEQQSSGTTPSPSSSSSSSASDVNQKLPKRICGDWSSKLKLLRYTSGSSLVGLHFVSDYSHHFGGYKAKAFMENSEYFTIHRCFLCIFATSNTFLSKYV